MSQSPLQGDSPEYRQRGDFNSVDGLLVALGVSSRTRAEQRTAVRQAWTIPSLRPLLRKIEDDLRAGGLL